jgi:hypothetical protein
MEVTVNRQPTRMMTCIRQSRQVDLSTSMAQPPLSAFDHADGNGHAGAPSLIGSRDQRGRGPRESRSSGIHIA